MITCKIEVVTFEMAAEWLRSNVDRNRKVVRTRVADYASDMRAGRWYNNGQPIMFNSNGHLCDGQHRLMAQVETRTDHEYVVVRGVPPQVFHTVDTGRARSLANVLDIKGFDASQLVGATVNALHLLESGRVGFGGSTRKDAFRLTHGEGLKVVSDNPDIKDSVEFCSKLGSFRGILGPGYATALHIKMSRVAGRRDADHFLTQLATGTGLEADDPLYVARERILAAKSTRRKMPKRDKVALVVKAWNMRRHGERCYRPQNLLWAPGKNEEFPTIE